MIIPVEQCFSMLASGWLVSSGSLYLQKFLAFSVASLFVSIGCGKYSTNQAVQCKCSMPLVVAAYCWLLWIPLAHALLLSRSPDLNSQTHLFLLGLTLGTLRYKNTDVIKDAVAAWGLCRGRRVCGGKNKLRWRDSATRPLIDRKEK